jgi:hypothetical protein
VICRLALRMSTDWHNSLQRELRRLFSGSKESLPSMSNVARNVRVPDGSHHDQIDFHPQQRSEFIQQAKISIDSGVESFLLLSEYGFLLALKRAWAWPFVTILRSLTRWTSLAHAAATVTVYRSPAR